MLDESPPQPLLHCPPAFPFCGAGKHVVGTAFLQLLGRDRVAWRRGALLQIPLHASAGASGIALNERKSAGASKIAEFLSGARSTLPPRRAFRTNREDWRAVSKILCDVDRRKKFKNIVTLEPVNLRRG